MCRVMFGMARKNAAAAAAMRRPARVDGIKTSAPAAKNMPPAETSRGIVNGLIPGGDGSAATR
jgi:hypothetical protein